MRAPWRCTSNLPGLEYVLRDAACSTGGRSCEVEGLGDVEGGEQVLEVPILGWRGAAPTVTVETT